MSTPITLDHLRHLAPNARSSYRQAFENGPPLLEASGISASPLRVAHFMAQVLHESTGLSVQIESLNYSPQRLPQV
ncbi:MAG: lytic enzyme, partial [Vicinamibacterales bacterium]